MADELSAPLGQGKTRKTFKLPPGVPVAIAGALGLCLAVFVLWAMFASDPFGGEPMAVVAAPDARTVVSKPDAAPDPSTVSKPAAAPEAAPAAEPPLRKPPRRGTTHGVAG